MATAEQIAQHLDGKWEMGQWRCLCPVHRGHSLMVRDKDGRPLIYCFGGCDFREVVQSLEAMGLWDSDKPSGPPERKVRWAKMVVELYEEELAKGTHLRKEDHRDYRKAKGILREASNAA